MKIKFILLLLLASLFSTCQKYPEGPFFSLRPKERRIAGGWVCEKYLIDGADSTIVKFPMANCVIKFTGKVGLASYENYNFSFGFCGDTTHRENGLWELHDKKNSILISGNVTGSNTNRTAFLLSASVAWKILELKHKEMHLQTDLNSKRYDAYLIRDY